MGGNFKKNNAQSKFIGKNFVFDKRLSERITEDILSHCHICKTPCDTHTNCSNQDCHILFIQCKKCSGKYQGCCSVECIKRINYSPEKQKEMRKGITNKKMYYSHKRVKLNLK